MNAELEIVLRDLWQKRRQDEWVFWNPMTGGRYTDRFDLMRRICKRAGVRPYTYHTIRHFVASYLYDKRKASVAGDQYAPAAHQLPDDGTISAAGRPEPPGNDAAPGGGIEGILKAARAE
jgi:hypothetical protein